LFRLWRSGLRPPGKSLDVLVGDSFEFWRRPKTAVALPDVAVALSRRAEDGVAHGTGKVSAMAHPDVTLEVLEVIKAGVGTSIPLFRPSDRKRTGVMDSRCRTWTGN